VPDPTAFDEREKRRNSALCAVVGPVLNGGDLKF